MSRPAFDLADFNRRINALPKEAVQAVKEALEKGADDCVALLERNVPKEHGDLAKTIQKAPGRSDLSVDISVGGPAAPYAAAVEFGHLDHGKHVAAHPYFFPAIRVTRKKLRAALIRAFNKAARAISS